MTVRGRLCVRLKVDPLALSNGIEDVAAALLKHVGHVWQFAQSEPVADGVASGAAIGRLTFGWTGPQAHLVDADARKRIERRLGDALAQLARQPAPALRAFAGPKAAQPVPGQPVPREPAAAWTYREIEFSAVLEQFLAFVTDGRTGVVPEVDQIRTRYDVLLAEKVAAVVCVVDVHQPVSWRSLIGALLDLALRRFGRGAPYAYIWDDARRADLIALDRKHLQGEVPPLKMPPTTPPRNVDFLVAADVRLAFAVCALPELTAADVADFEPAWQVDVLLAELVQSGMVPHADLVKFYRLTDEEVAFAITYPVDLQVPVRVVPLTVRRRISVASLNVLLLEYVQSVDINAHLFGRLLLLSQAALDQLPATVSARVRATTDEATLRARDEPDQKAAAWRPGWRGVFVHPLLDGVRDYAVRSKAIARVRTTIVAELVAILTDTDALASFIDRFPEDPILFEALLDGLAMQGNLDRFFDTIRQAKGNKWEWDRPRQFKVARLAYKTRYRNNPALLALVNSLKFHGFRETALTGPQHTFDLASQSVFLLGKSDRRVKAQGASQDNKAGVVAEVSDYYSETATVYQPGQELMKNLAEPTRKKIGEIAIRMACSGAETLTEHELIAEAAKAAMKELVPPPEKKDFVAVKMRRSFRVLALEEPVIDGVPQLRIRCEPVAKVGDGPWEAIGPAESFSPGRFDAELRYFHVQHMMTALTVFFLVEAVVGGAIFIVATGIASLGEVILMIAISEVMYFWTTPAEERSLQGILMAALVAELDLVGFKALSFVSKSGLKLVAGRFITGKMLGSTITKWVAFGLRGTVTAAEVGAIGVLDLFAHELFRMTRCRGFSSGEDYWEHFKVGFKIGLLFEFVAVPWLAPIARLGIEKASTYLEASQILQKSGKVGEIVATLLRGQNKLEEALGRTLEPKLAEPIARSFKDHLDRMFQTLGREYKSRAYGAVFGLLDVNLSRAGREGLSRLLSSVSEREIDRLLVALRQAKIAPADFLRVVGELDSQALAEMLAGTNLRQLARSPNVLSFLSVGQPAALRILRGPFQGSIDALERYLGALERLPAPNRTSVLEALLATPGGTAEWANLLLRATRALGPLDKATVEWLNRLHAARIRIDPLFENGGKPFRDFVGELSTGYTAGDQAFALRAAQGGAPSFVLRRARELKKTLQTGARDIAPTRQELTEQLKAATRGQARTRVKEAFREGRYQTTIFDSALADNVKAYAQLRDTMRALNPDAIYAVERGGPFVADAITYGELSLRSRIVRWPKPDVKAGWDDALEKMQAAIEKRIVQDGQTRFAFTDVYFSGASYNKFQKMIEALANKYRNCTFEGFWMREQIGFEIGGGSAGPVLRAPKEVPLANVRNHTPSVPFAIGDDAERLVEGVAAEPIYVFDKSGSIQRVIEPKPQESTRDLIIRVLNGGT